jgi:hypothetical protein
MSKFLLNLLLQISKALVYSKIKFYSKENFSVTFSPAAAHFLFFSFQPAVPPSPLGLGHSAARSAQLATRRWRPARLPPPSRGDASSPTCHPSPLAPPELGHAATASHHSSHRPAPHLRMPPQAITHPTITPPLTSPLSSMALKPLKFTPPLPPPSHPSAALPRPL